MFPQSSQTGFKFPALPNSLGNNILGSNHFTTTGAFPDRQAGVFRGPNKCRVCGLQCANDEDLKAHIRKENHYESSSSSISKVSTPVEPFRLRQTMNDFNVSTQPSINLRQTFSPPPLDETAEREKKLRESLMTRLKTKVEVPITSVVVSARDSPDSILDLTTNIDDFDRGRLIDHTATCEDMCPEVERQRRSEEYGALHELEQCYPNVPEFATLKQTMIKRFQKSAADHDLNIPALVRTPRTLLRTIRYMEDNIMDAFEVDETDASESSPSMIVVYLFIWDRFRMIAKDFTLMNPSLGINIIWIECHERMARWYVYMDHRMKSDDDYMKAGHGQQNAESLNNIFKTLTVFYSIGMSCDPPLPLPNKAELIGYFILFQIGNKGEITKFLQQLGDDYFQADEVKFAIQVWRAIKSDNYCVFFKLLRQANLLQASMMHRYVSEVRVTALRKMCKSFAAPGSMTMPCYYPLTELNELLMFENMDETRDFVTHCGFDIDDDSEDGSCILLDNQNFNTMLPADKNGNPVFPVAWCMLHGIESKRYDDDHEALPIRDICRGVASFAVRFEDETCLRTTASSTATINEYAISDDDDEEVDMTSASHIAPRPAAVYNALPASAIKTISAESAAEKEKQRQQELADQQRHEQEKEQRERLVKLKQMQREKDEEDERRRQEQLRLMKIQMENEEKEALERAQERERELERERLRREQLLIEEAMRRQKEDEERREQERQRALLAQAAREEQEREAKRIQELKELEAERHQERLLSQLLTAKRSRKQLEVLGAWRQAARVGVYYDRLLEYALHWKKIWRRYNEIVTHRLDFFNDISSISFTPKTPYPRRKRMKVSRSSPVPPFSSLWTDLSLITVKKWLKEQRRIVVSDLTHRMEAIGTALYMKQQIFLRQYYNDEARSVVWNRSLYYKVAVCSMSLSGGQWDGRGDPGTNSLRAILANTPDGAVIGSYSSTVNVSSLKDRSILRDVYITVCDVSASSPTTLMNGTQMAIISVDHNDLERPSPAWINHLRGISDIKLVFMQGRDDLTRCRISRVFRDDIIDPFVAWANRTTVDSHVVSLFRFEYPKNVEAEILSGVEELLWHHLLLPAEQRPEKETGCYPLFQRINLSLWLQESFSASIWSVPSSTLSTILPRLREKISSTIEFLRTLLDDNQLDASAMIPAREFCDDQGYIQDALFEDLSLSLLPISSLHWTCFQSNCYSDRIRKFIAVVERLHDIVSCEPEYWATKWTRRDNRLDLYSLQLYKLSTPSLANKMMQGFVEALLDAIIDSGDEESNTIIWRIPPTVTEDKNPWIVTSFDQPRVDRVVDVNSLSNCEAAGDATDEEVTSGAYDYESMCDVILHRSSNSFNRSPVKFVESRENWLAHLVQKERASLDQLNKSLEYSLDEVVECEMSSIAEAEAKDYMVGLVNDPREVLDFLERARSERLASDRWLQASANI